MYIAETSEQSVQFSNGDGSTLINLVKGGAVSIITPIGEIDIDANGRIALVNSNASITMAANGLITLAGDLGVSFFKNGSQQGINGTITVGTTHYNFVNGLLNSIT